MKQSLIKTGSSTESLDTASSSLLPKLKDLPLFSNIDSSVLETFVSTSIHQNFHKNNMLYAHGDEAHYFYIIQSGWVKLYKETLDGEEAILDILTTGHVFGEDALFSDNHHTCYAEAIETLDVIMIPLPALAREINTNNQLALNLLAAMSKHRRQQEQHIEHMSLQNAPQRIGCFLLRLCKANDPSPKELLLPYDKTLIASRLGMKAETFSRGLSSLKKSNLITVKGGTVIIHSIEALSSSCCSACSHIYPCPDIC